MKKLLLVISAIVIMMIVNAQELSNDFTVTTAEPYKVIDAKLKKYIPLNDGTAFLFKQDGEIVHIQKFDVNGMKEMGRNAYKDFPDIYKPIDVVELDNEIYFIYEAFDKKAKTITVFTRKINKADASFDTPVEHFTTSRNVVKLFGDTQFGVTSVAGRFVVSKSFDFSKVLVVYRSNPLTKNDDKSYDEIGFLVFDNKMNKISSNEVKMPYTEAQMNHLAFAVSSEGNAKMLIAHREREIYEMLSIDATGNLTIKDLGISTDKMVLKFEVQEDVAGDFLCLGFYTNGIEFKYSFVSAAFVMNVNGLLCIEIDKEGNVLKNKNYDFSPEFIKQNLSDKQIKKVEDREAEDKAGIHDLVLTNVVIKNDGSVIVVGERQYARNEYMGATKKWVNHYSNVVVMKIDTNGELVWMKKLPKNQADVGGIGLMGIAYMEGPTADYIAYVDNPENISLTAEGGVPEAFKKGKDGFLTTYKVDYATGSIEKHTICDLNNIKDGMIAYQFNTTRIFKSTNGVFLTEIYIKNKEDSMVKFEVN